jgi:pyridoxal phosphate enzyme (YggS family)
MVLLEKFNQNIQKTTEEIKNSVKNLNKKPKTITLIAVTKNQPILAWQALLESNIQDIGENKVQETIRKIKLFPQRNFFKFHLIGHLQKNKVKKAVETFDVIQTVDTLQLAEKINNVSKEKNKQQEIYIQININKDPQKNGMFEEEVIKKVKKIISMNNIILTGVMTILKNGLSKKQTMSSYVKVKKIQENIKNTICHTCINSSMGMSKDYKEAIKAGATHIRLGTNLFGNIT